MARRLRLQYDGALYHIINRGNYRRDVFETAGATRAFEAALFEAADRHRWRLHAHAVMRNHFHLALETPEANLVEGMHWLQSTYATRFNRFRSERGHLFQGRYQSPVIEDAAALVRVINYIHLNPVAAGIVEMPALPTYPWTSLARFLQGPRPPCLTAGALLAHLELPDSAAGWSNYVAQLEALVGDPAAQESAGWQDFSKGWAIGTHGWRRALAKEHAQYALEVGIAKDELREIKEARWRLLLEHALRAAGKSAIDIEHDCKGAAWKIELARRLRVTAAAPYRWIAAVLKMGSPASVRVYLCQQRRTSDPNPAPRFNF